MEWIGWVCLFIIICYSSYPAKVKKLESKVKKLERKEKGEGEMSEIIDELVGENCKITTRDGILFSGNTNVQCTVLDVDDEWIKVTYKDKKEFVKTRILRIDSIEDIELVDE